MPLRARAQSERRSKAGGLARLSRMARICTLDLCDAARPVSSYITDNFADLPACRYLSMLTAIFLPSAMAQTITQAMTPSHPILPC
jgi:hypothetical protein